MDALCLLVPGVVQLDRRILIQSLQEVIDIAEVTFNGALINLPRNIDLIPNILSLLIEVGKLGLEAVHDLVNLFVLGL